jgi:hypothetical protein
MKLISPLNVIVLFIIVIVNTHCNRPVIEPTNVPPLRANLADANADITIETPATSIMLNGRAKPYNASGHLVIAKWNKISGPACIIENPQMLQTKVSGLEKGTYKFELNIWDNGGYFDIDTMTLHVVDPGGPNTQILFQNMKMIVEDGPLDMYRFFLIENFHEFVAPNTTFAVFIKLGTSPNWESVVAFPPGNPSFTGLAYSINTNNDPSLTISELPDGFASTVPSDIKIVY